MSEQENTQISEESGQIGQAAEQTETRDYESLFNAEVGNSKKLRKRAQEVEKQLESINLKIETQKEEKLIADGNLQELVDGLKADNKKMKAEQMESMSIVSKIRADLLNQVPEEEREALQDLPYNTLKLVVDKMTNIPASALPNTTPGVKEVVMDKPYGQMTEDERRAYHNAKVNQL